jgi:hypothetical protein
MLRYKGTVAFVALLLATLSFGIYQDIRLTAKRGLAIERMANK